MPVLLNFRVWYFTGTVLEFCCYGYLIDMIDMMSINMSLTFDLHLVQDGRYGGQVKVINEKILLEISYFIYVAIPVICLRAKY